MKLTLFSLLITIPSILFALDDEPKTVDHVDLDRYLGRWYEIASIPQKFQKNCTNSQATYKRSKYLKSFIVVINECKDKADPEKTRRARGIAWVADKNTNAKLKVSFFPPFAGNYWILELDSDYNYAVVGDPTREYLWILSRTPALAVDILDDLLLKIKEKHGYDLSKITIHAQD